MRTGPINFLSILLGQKSFVTDTQEILKSYFTSIFLICRNNAKSNRQINIDTILASIEEYVAHDEQHAKLNLRAVKNFLIKIAGILFPLISGDETEITQKLSQRFLSEHPELSSYGMEVDNFVIEALVSAVNQINMFHAVLSKKIEHNNFELNPRQAGHFSIDDLTQAISDALYEEIREYILFQTKNTPIRKDVLTAQYGASENYQAQILSGLFPSYGTPATSDAQTNVDLPEEYKYKF